MSSDPPESFRVRRQAPCGSWNAPGQGVVPSPQLPLPPPPGIRPPEPQLPESAAALRGRSAVHPGAGAGSLWHHPHRPLPDPATGALKIDPEIDLKAKRFNLAISF